METPLKKPYQYVIDTSALFDLKDQYPENIFPGVWERLNEMCNQQLIIAPREVLREIQKGNDELIAWSERYENIFLEPCEEEMELLENILSFYPEKIILKYSTRPWADPFVLACAKHYSLPIIQHEIIDPNQFKIPTIAKKLNLKFQRLIEFFEDENWIFQ